MINVEPIALSSESTVVAEYVPEPAGEAYQSEAALERELIRLLQEQAYEYLPIATEADLVSNLRRQLERLNDVTFSDAEWARFFERCIAGRNDGIVEKTVRIQEDHVQVLRRDDGTSKNIALLDKRHIHSNRLQVINQYEAAGSYANRYDVTILVNGLPLVHVELKRRGVDIREAFNQIDRYQRDSFWAGSGLFEYVQLFVISNGTLTKYYSNTTRRQHLAEARGARRRSAHSFEFTSWWADAHNRPIQELTAFAKTFFAKHTLLNLLTRYCVLTDDRLLLAMRPYQIVATERILQRIDAATTYRKLGTLAAGGYIWHTTGSGKTLTSFKTAQLATGLPGVEKVLFVVDRKDLDYQTMREYDRFQKGAANSNTSTAVLKRQLEDPGARIIITTIQKLANFIKANQGHPVYRQHVVLIFDECHRSQFGDMHTAVTKAFKRYHLFGFTGTPIFAANSASGGDPRLKTTEQAFGDRLHTYTIVDAITDKNVLPFRIDYIKTIQVGAVDDKQVTAIDTEQALLAPERIRQIVRYTLDHYDQKTRRTAGHGKGFNALFATASIEAARRYYNHFRLEQDERGGRRLRIALIYSYGANDPADSLIDDEAFDTDSLSTSDRGFLEDAIQDYNELFKTSFDTSSDGFQSYYKDLSQRLKSRDVDLVIVVNMFLTGFDATTLNTLFVDKNLRSHGLIQAYSRTNRILNSVKTYGNIVAFRDLEEETTKALELFGNREARGVVLLKPYAEYLREYSKRVAALLSDFPLGAPIVGEGDQKRFVADFGALLRLENILSSFDDFNEVELLTDRQKQDYRSVYLDLHAEFRELAAAEKESITEDVVFEIELVKQVEINVDYILMLVERSRRDGQGGGDKELRVQIGRAVAASPTLRGKRDLIEAFVETVSPDCALDQAWAEFVAAQRDAELAKLIEEEGLRPEAARRFVADAFRRGALQAGGTAIIEVLPPVSRFAPEGGHAEKKQRVLARLGAFFERFYGLGGEPV